MTDSADVTTQLSIIEERKQEIALLLQASGVFNGVVVEFEDDTYHINGEATSISLRGGMWIPEFYFMMAGSYNEPPELVERELGQYFTLYAACVKVAEQTVEDRMFCAAESKSYLDEPLEAV